MTAGRVTLAIVTLALTVSGAVASASPPGRHCRVVKVVDGKGRPLAGAEVSLLPCDAEAEDCSDRSTGSRDWTTDRNGQVCAHELLAIDRGGALEVTAPVRFGGFCAARKHWAYPTGVPDARGTAPISVTLDVSPLPKALLTGRITSVDGRPIKGAKVDLELVALTDTCGLYRPRLVVRSSGDGRFSFPPGPQRDGEAAGYAP